MDTNTGTTMENSRRVPRTTVSLRTSFLIANLHCPTCVSRIEELMAELKPSPFVHNVSIVDHVATIDHDESISTESISDLLESAAYEVYDIVLDPASTERLVQHPKHEGHFGQAIERWSPKVSSKLDAAARAEHEKNCQSCAAERVNEKNALADTISISVASSAPDTANYEVVFSIEGMSCSSCVPNVTEALNSVGGVIKVEVALVSMSARVQLRAQDPDALVKELIEAVDDVGYGAELSELKPLRALPDSRHKVHTDTWKVTYSIDGMSCSSCVGSITTALEKLDFVKKVDVNLVANAGGVIFDGKGNESLIAAAIDDLGYEATKIEFISLESEERRQRRRVSLKVDGMHCAQCPQRILSALKELPLEVEKAPELDIPVLIISYLPSAPVLTIRTILAKVTQVDTAFVVSVYHPQTVEERSRKMLAKERRSILRRVLFCIATAIPTLIIGIVYMNLVSHSDPGYMYLMEPVAGVSKAEWATFIMATLVYFYGADHFHKRTLKEIYAMWRPRSAVPFLRRFYRFGSMNMLISLGTSIAYFSSLASMVMTATSRSNTGQSPTHSYFDSVVFLSMFLLIGRFIEAHMKAKSGDAVSALGRLRPTDANLIVQHEKSDEKLERMHVDLIDVGDIVKVLKGSTPPCDGILLDEHGEFDESSLTGESRIIAKRMGDSIYSGTINRGSAISIRVTGPAGASLLDSIIEVVREGQAKRAPMERIADLLTAYFVPVVVLIAIITWLVWLGLGLSGTLPNGYLDSDSAGWPYWSLQFAIAVFVIACPCGLGLAAPTALFVGGGMAARRGILVKGGGEAFQEASNLDAVVFDKTGTLTEGVEPKIVDYRMLLLGDSALKDEVVLGVLKSMEENSSHPLAKAAVNFANDNSAEPVRLVDVDEIAGKGLKASFTVATAIDRARFEALVGNESLMSDYAVPIQAEEKTILESWKSSGYSVILLAMKESETWHIGAIFAAADPLRPEAKAVVEALRSQHVAVWMLSGDNASTAKAVGAQVGIPPENIIAGVLPAQKAEKIKHLQMTVPKSRSKGILSSLTNRRSRPTIAMVGDGINDAPALAAADVGIAVASGSDVAVQSAAFVLVHSDLRAVLTLVTLSRAVFRRVIQNFFWAAIYNMIALPIAAGVLYPIRSGGTHVRLDPAWAALAMALSSITVVGSSLLLRTRIPLVGFQGDKTAIASLK